MHTYDVNFYEDQRDHSRRSAEEVVPVVLEYVRPRRVVDVGCGVGTWLSVFRERGVEDVTGVDGDYVDRSMLLIPAERFVPHDLTKPLPVEGPFDLVVSLEVAEHLPAQFADSFVESLTRLGPAVLFSAAVPLQGGEHHVNEQWPEYWAEKFAARGYVPVDCVRQRVWTNERVQTCYAQNVLLYARRDYLEGNAALRAEYERGVGRPLALVHPKNYLVRSLYLDTQQVSLKQALALVPRLAKNAVARRARKLFGGGDAGGGTAAAVEVEGWNKAR